MASPELPTPSVTPRLTTNSRQARLSDDPALRGRTFGLLTLRPGEIETDSGVMQPPENTGNKASFGGSSSSSTDVDPASYTSYPAAPTQERASATEVSKREAREQRHYEARKRRMKEVVAQSLGRDVDSITPDNKRAYKAKMKEKHDAEYARQQALSPEEKRQESIQLFAQILRRHLEAQHAPGELQLPLCPMFQLQETPRRSKAACKLCGCAYLILPGSYRIAVKPGNNSSGNPGKTECRLAIFEYFFLRPESRLLPS
ncbi:hypothetical protein BDW59DRAFT_163856 [Aspergillus cavernicola]|uniref:Uncharacterized protein n=1 Tax=Aspergillus cavernicola TaxID=176166 RepID=A0ABR4I3T6_9EURO